MKMTKEDYEYIKSELEKTVAFDPETIERYETGEFVRSECVKNLQTRYMWDCFHNAQFDSFVHTLYKYLHDSHIETALRKILPTVTRRY